MAEESSNNPEVVIGPSGKRLFDRELDSEAKEVFAELSDPGRDLLIYAFRQALATPVSDIGALASAMSKKESPLSQRVAIAALWAGEAEDVDPILIDALKRIAADDADAELMLDVRSLLDMRIWEGRISPKDAAQVYEMLPPPPEDMDWYG